MLINSGWRVNLLPRFAKRNWHHNATPRSPMYNKLWILQMTPPLNALSRQISGFLSAENPA